VKDIYLFNYGYFSLATRQITSVDLMEIQIHAWKARYLYPAVLNTISSSMNSIPQSNLRPSFHLFNKTIMLTLKEKVQDIGTR
jgi:hypothetical protein